MEFFSNFIQTLLPIVVIDFLRYFIPAGLAFVLCWKLFRQKLLNRFIQPRWPSNKRIWSEFKYSISTVVIFALVGVGIVYAEKHDWTQFYHQVSEHGWAYLFVSFVIMVLFHDTYFYWTHRWMHLPRIFKYVHKVHHLSINPSPWAAYSFHPLEAVIQALVFPIMVFLIPVHTGVAFAFLVYMILRNVWGHLGFELFPAKFIKLKWLNWHTTTTHHNLHHERFNSNYGLYFTWWDRWFGTENKNYRKKFIDITGRKPEVVPGKKRVAKYTFLLAIILAVSSSLCGQSPSGKWLTYHEGSGDPISIVHIYKDQSSDTWHGRVDSVILRPNQGKWPVCSECPSPFLNKPVIGMQFLWGFRNYRGRWENGRILDPESGKIYNSRIWSIENGQLKVRGYAGPLDLIHRTQTWQQLKGSGIEGLWLVLDDNFHQPKALVKLEVVNNMLTGTIEEIFLLPHQGNYPLCIECKGALANQPVVGMEIMRGFKPQGREWKDGTIIDPGNGTTYAASFWLTDRDTLKIRGYWGPFYRTQVWSKFKDPRPGIN